MHLAHFSIDPDHLAVSVLDTLHLHVAVLDSQGQILFVNQGWRRFCLENGGSDLLACGVGMNYFDACRSAARAGMQAAQRTLEGLLDVIAGRAALYEAEYPCDSPIQKRWFHLKACPIALNRQAGLLIWHTNITTLRQVDRQADRLRELAGR